MTGRAIEALTEENKAESGGIAMLKKEELKNNILLELIPDKNNIGESLRLSEKYGASFEYNDFMLGSVLYNKKAAAGLIDFYKSLERDRGLDTLHGAFLDITPHSDDPEIRAISEKRMRQSMDVASALGVRAVIFHTNTIPNFRSSQYLDNWLKRNEELIRRLSEEYSGTGIFMENMFDETPEDLMRLAESLRDLDSFGVCLDYAHASVFGKKLPVREWTDSLMPYVKHIHINDNDLSIDRHWTVGEGSINWLEFSESMKFWMERKSREDNSCISVLIEMNDMDSFERSCEYMIKHDIYPFYRGNNA